MGLGAPSFEIAPMMESSKSSIAARMPPNKLDEAC